MNKIVSCLIIELLVEKEEHFIAEEAYAGTDGIFVVINRYVQKGL